MVYSVNLYVHSNCTHCSSSGVRGGRGKLKKDNHKRRGKTPPLARFCTTVTKICASWPGPPPPGNYRCSAESLIRSGFQIQGTSGKKTALQALRVSLSKSILSSFRNGTQDTTNGLPHTLGSKGASQLNAEVF